MPVETYQKRTSWAFRINTPPTPTPYFPKMFIRTEGRYEKAGIPGNRLTVSHVQETGSRFTGIPAFGKSKSADQSKSAPKASNLPRKSA